MAAIAKKKNSRTDPEKAVLIAKDVIKWVKAEKLQFSHSTYVTQRDDSPDLALPVRDQAQAHVPKLLENCEVCALGACFLGYVNRFNGVKVGALQKISVWTEQRYIDFDRDKLTKKLLAAFDRKSMDLIEDAYERFYGETDYVTYEESRCAERFGEQFEDDGERLIAIMKNVIKNKGRFIPPAIEEDSEEV